MGTGEIGVGMGGGGLPMKGHSSILGTDLQGGKLHAL